MSNRCITWEAKEGAVCPVADGALVDIKCGAISDSIYYAEKSDEWGWDDVYAPITHYRLHDGTNLPDPGSDAEMIAELLVALQAAEVALEFSLSYYDGDGSVGALKLVRDAIHKAEYRQ